MHQTTRSHISHVIYDVCKLLSGVRPAVSRRVAAEEPEADCVCSLCAEPLEVQVDDQDDWIYTASLRVDSQVL